MGRPISVSMISAKHLHTVFLLCIFLCTAHAVCAQDKKKINMKDADTVIYVDEDQPAQPQQPALNSSNTMVEETVIILDSGKKKPIVPVRDTVIIIKKGKKADELAEKHDIKKAVLVKGECDCMQMELEVAETLQYEQYLNYGFKFTNKCKNAVWVSSKHFRFVPFNAFGERVKVIRKMSFVKRFDYPAFVKIEPEETFTFQYGDDPFFEYKLDKGGSYKFVFVYGNNKEKHKGGTTLMCTKTGEKMIMIH